LFLLTIFEKTKNHSARDNSNKNKVRSIDSMFKLNNLSKIVLLTFFICGYVCADNEVQSTKASQLEQFEKDQKCYAVSVKLEYWKLGLDCAKSSLDLGRKLFSSRHKKIAMLTHNYGLMLAKNRDYTNAVDELKKAYKLYKKHYGKKSETVGRLLVDLANVQVKYSARQASKNYLKALEILSIQESFTPMDKAKIALEASVYLSGANGLSTHSIKAALEMAQSAYKTYFEAYGAKHDQTALAAFVIGKLHYSKRDYIMAQKFLEQSLTNPYIGKYAHGILVDIHTKNGRSDLAQKHQQALGTVLPEQSDNSRYTPIFVKDPKYPKRAMRSNKDGYAIISVTITEQGGVSDPMLVEEYPENMGFGKAALKVANKLKFIPQVKDGEAIAVPNVLYKYSFKIQKGGILRSQ